MTQLWEPCPKCGREPVYPENGGYCRKCGGLPETKPSIDASNDLRGTQYDDDKAVNHD